MSTRLMVGIITKTHPCNIVILIEVVKFENFHYKFLHIFLIFAPKHRLWVHVRTPLLTSTHNLCFGAKIRKIGVPLHTPILLYKAGV